MTFLRVTAVLLMATAPAAACNEDLFSVQAWQAQASKDGRNVRTEMNVQLTYSGDRSYRMIHGAVLFSDVLSNALVTVPLERDEQVEPGAAVTAKGTFIGKDSRVTTINRDDIVTRTCVWSIAYDDGTIEKFE